MTDKEVIAAALANGEAHTFNQLWTYVPHLVSAQVSQILMELIESGDVRTLTVNAYELTAKSRAARLEAERLQTA